MLNHLSIQNYALIDNLEINFSEGLTIITGETGAGKSILLGALGLVAGNRADTQVLNEKTKKCVVEASFELNKNRVNDFFQTNELDFELVTIIRREINSEGKSRAFINDTPVTLTQLKELTGDLVDIHSQHETRTLNGSEFQLSVVDAFAKNASALNEYAIQYKGYKSIEKKLSLLIEQELNAKKELDYLQFQFNELEDANLIADSQQTIEQELETLNNAEEIKLALSKASFGLNGNEQNILTLLNEIKNLLLPFAKFKTEINVLTNRINSTYIELKDISAELENIEQEIIYDPKRIESLTEQLDGIYRLQQKHQVKTIEELLSIKESLSDKLLDYSSLETEIEKTKKEKESLHKSLNVLSKNISDNRKKVIPKIEKEIAILLSSLAMPNAKLSVEQTETENFTSNGKDKINFMFSANKGSDFKELNRVASGGELSRLMLCIKSLISSLTDLPTIIFDEIDTGVSGDIADKVGNIMNVMAEKMQVITITHLPQIASKGENHLFVFKEEKNKKTITNIKKLNADERITEIAKMLSTGTPTTAAISNAKELLKS